MKLFSKSILRFLSFLLLASLLIVCFSACGQSDRKIDAWVCAQKVVSDRLKSPSTAKFCSYPSATVIDLGDNKYKISGYVDAQNGFGAMIRSNFTVTLTLTENGFKDASCNIS